MSIPVKVRLALRERANGCCEICGTPNANNAHHRKNRSQGRYDVLSNLMLLCGSGVSGCHGVVTLNPNWSNYMGFSVRSHEDPAAKPVRLDGQWWLLLDDGSKQLVEEVA